MKDFYCFSHSNLNPCFVGLWCSDVLSSFCLYVFTLWKLLRKGSRELQYRQNTPSPSLNNTFNSRTYSSESGTYSSEFNFKWVQSNLFRQMCGFRESHLSQTWNGTKSIPSDLGKISTAFSEIFKYVLHLLWSAYYEYLHNEVRWSVSLNGFGSRTSPVCMYHGVG